MRRGFCCHDDENGDDLRPRSLSASRLDIIYNTTESWRRLTGLSCTLCGRSAGMISVTVRTDSFESAFNWHVQRKFSLMCQVVRCNFRSETKSKCLP